jgi:hypothetical protein
MAMKSPLLVIILALVAFAPKTSNAWGGLGHDIICRIAYEELSQDVRSEIDALIAGDKEFRSFGKSCSWPDHPRIKSKWHYVNLERHQKHFDKDACPVEAECVVTAIIDDSREMALVLDNQVRLELLKRLSHWVGDIHQPMHVSFADDRGANKIDVDSPCDSNLHAVWDTCIIKEVIGRDAKVVAQKLSAEITDVDREQWGRFDFADRETIISWANESFKIATKAATEYCKKINGVCQYSETEINFTGAEKDVDADMQYLERHAPTVAVQLKRSGVRLAGLLERVLAD